MIDVPLIVDSFAGLARGYCMSLQITSVAIAVGLGLGIVIAFWWREAEISHCEDFGVASTHRLP